MEDRCVEHSFSIELKSKEHVKNINLTDKIQKKVLFEGTLGNMEEISLIEGKVFEFKGKNGTLRLDICPDELNVLFKKEKNGG